MLGKFNGLKMLNSTNMHYPVLLKNIQASMSPEEFEPVLIELELVMVGADISFTVLRLWNT